MSDYLKKHAIDNVWCSPEQDNQTCLAVKRITVPTGEVVSFPIMKRRIALPTKDRRYHVFQVGQNHPVLLGLLKKTPDWQTPEWLLFSDAVEELDLVVNIYNDAGVSIPLHRTYYMWTPDRALVFAVDPTVKSPVDFGKDQLYFRFYTNAFYSTSQAASLARRTRVVGTTIKNTQNIIDMQMTSETWKTWPGKVFCYVNGHLVESISPFTTALGDVVECVYDASIKAIYDFKISDLLTFTSDLDECVKYLLHPPGKSSVIDYVDDIDLYVLSFSAVGYKGRYFHKNRGNALRMVTHRDYSLRVDMYVSIAERFAAYLSEVPMDLRDMTVRLYVRSGGLDRGLIQDHNRIFELYKLPEEKIVQALRGVESTMPYWTAAALENSDYCKLMRINYAKLFTDNLVEKAYGYNSISRIIGDSPIKTRLVGNQVLADLPLAYYERCTVYEYDANGLLLGFHSHQHGSVYYAVNPECALIEAIEGFGSWNAPAVEGQDNLDLPDDYSYRVYMCYVVGGQPTRQWRDITDTEHYHVENGKLIWNNLESEQWLQVRTDKDFLTYTLDLQQTAGTFYFDLSEYVEGVYRLMDIPMGTLDIWLNGYSLINKLCYFVDFPRVYIVDKEKLLQPAMTEAQKVVVRMTGFCNTLLQMNAPKEYGYVEHGVLSNNEIFNIRDDKVVRITVDGRLKHRDDVIFSEEHQGISVVNAINGAPYQVADVVVPLNWLAEEETYALRTASLQVDAAVSDYLTRLIPEPDRNAISTATSRYMLASPFFTHIANDLVNKDFPMAELEKTLSDNAVLELCKPYEKLLKFDPINPENNIQHRFVVIHPTERLVPITLSLQAYRFMQRVVDLYGRGLVSISGRIIVSLGGN